MRLRSKAREVALHLLYQIEITKQDYKSAHQNYLEHNPQEQEVGEFSFVLIEGVKKNLTFIDPLIQKYVKNWEIERMAAIDRNILRMACFELLMIEDIPPKVTINEAIELAKNFGDIDSPRFVNGVMDKIYKMEKQENRQIHCNEEKDINGPGSSSVNLYPYTKNDERRQQ